MLIRYDLRGHGLSEAPAPPYSAADLAGDVVAILDRLEHSRRRSFAAYRSAV